jgi:hypothetical protein
MDGMNRPMGCVAEVDRRPPNETLITRETRYAAPRRLWRRISSGITALLVVAVAGCGGDSSTAPRNTDPVGLYALRQADRNAIPTQIFRGPLGGYPDFTIGVTGGELVLEDDNSFSLAVDLSLSADGQTIPRIVKINGNYEITGSQLTLTNAAGTSLDATLRNGVVAMELDLVGNGALKEYTFRFVP